MDDGKDEKSEVERGRGGHQVEQKVCKGFWEEMGGGSETGDHLNTLYSCMKLPKNKHKL